MMSKCRVVLLNVYPVEVKKGNWSVEDGVIKVRLSWRRVVGFNVTKGVNPVSFKVRRRVVPLFFVDMKSRETVCLDGGLAEDIAEETATKLDLLMQTKFWRAMGGRALDTVEMLITLSAGYGFLRLVEFIIGALFG